MKISDAPMAGMTKAQKEQQNHSDPLRAREKKKKLLVTMPMMAMTHQHQKVSHSSAGGQIHSLCCCLLVFTRKIYRSIRGLVQNIFECFGGLTTETEACSAHRDHNPFTVVIDRRMIPG